MFTLTWVAILAIGGFFVLLAVIVGGVSIAVYAQGSDGGPGSQSVHPDVVPCPQCGLVALPGKNQCPSCGCKISEFAGR
jgi:hypothetical protein